MGILRKIRKNLEKIFRERNFIGVKIRVTSVYKITSEMADGKKNFEIMRVPQNRKKINDEKTKSKNAFE